MAEVRANVSRRRDILIACRNKQVSAAIDENYRKDTGDDADAAIYCVSNRMYLRHLRGHDKSDDQQTPTMTLEETQIPDICSHIYVLPSKGRTADLDHFVRASIPMLLSIIQMSCSTTTIARINHLTAIIQQARQVCDYYLLLTDYAGCAHTSRPWRPGSVTSLSSYVTWTSRHSSINLPITSCKLGSTRTQTRSWTSGSSW